MADELRHSNVDGLDLIAHRCGGSEGCMCVYDPECNPDLKVSPIGSLHADRAEIRRLSSQLAGAVDAGDALADAVADVMADDPTSVLHTWVARWRAATHPGGQSDA